MRFCSNPLVHSDFIYSLTKDGKQNQRYLNLVHRVAMEVIAQTQGDIGKTNDEMEVSNCPRSHYVGNTIVDRVEVSGVSHLLIERKSRGS